MSDGQRQLARRAASLSFACEMLESKLVGGPGEATWMQHAEGLSPFDILRESARILHAVARIKGGGGADEIIHQIAALPDDELTRVVDLLVKAGDLSHKAMSGGGDRAADLELLATLTGRLVRCFAQLGLRRQARDVGSLTLADVLREDALEQQREAAAKALGASAGSADAQ